MIVTTSSTIAGKKIIKTIGIVKGNTVRARHIGKDIVALFKNLVGGEIQEYTKLLAESREQSVDRMISEAEKLGANAIVDARFGTSYIMQNAAEILVFGTAVVVKDE
ncbi:MAG: YbjQ family protein [Bacteroidota bacterium]|nr:YbjQ family protein [Bacteroidota bacterium]